MCIHYIRDGVTRLTGLKKMIVGQINRAEKAKKEIEEADIMPHKSSFYGIAIEMVNAFTEVEFSLYPHIVFNTGRDELLEGINAVKESSSLQTIVDVIDEILLIYKDFDYNNHSTYDMRREYRSSYDYSHECTIDEFLLQLVGKSFKTDEDRPIRVLDPRPRNGESIKSLKQLMPENVVTYAAAVPENNGPIVKEHFDRVALGTLKGSTISNEVFDVMFLQPPVTLEKQNERIMLKRERDYIRDTFKYLRPGGYLVLVLPHFRFYRDICLLLAKNYTNFKIRKFAGSSFNNTGSLFLVAQKKDVKKDGKEVDQKDYQLLRHLYSLDHIENIMEKDFGELKLPEGELEVKFFRGSILDKEEMKNIFQNSGGMDQFWKAQVVEKISENPQSPLLPFNTGQLGLVLTSGVLDGVVDEGYGYRHVVKGRVVKKTDSERDYGINAEGTRDSLDLVETTSNRVEINVMLPDGTHKVLA